MVAGVVDGDDVRITETRRGSRFLLETKPRPGLLGQARTAATSPRPTDRAGGLRPRGPPPSHRGRSPARARSGRRSLRHRGWSSRHQCSPSRLRRRFRSPSTRGASADRPLASPTSRGSLSGRSAMTGGMSRRRFLGLAAGSAALATAGISQFDLVAGARPATGTVPTNGCSSRSPSCSRTCARAISRARCSRRRISIDSRLNGFLHAVIEVNPDARSIAQQLDRERRRGHVRGPLHGIPVLVKDNIATADAMQTTAGSLALVGSRVPADAPIVHRLRRRRGDPRQGEPVGVGQLPRLRAVQRLVGAAGSRAIRTCSSADPCGSSSGSAVAVAAGLCSVAVGTETDGSVVCPSGNNGIVGLKPTIGVLSPDGIIPIAHSQDTAGPMGRHVVDVAILLDAMRGDGAGGRSRPEQPAALRRRASVSTAVTSCAASAASRIVAVVEDGLDMMRGLGATLVDTDTGNPNAYGDAELTVLLFEFKVQVAEYLRHARPHRHAHPRRPDRVQQRPLRSRDALLRPGDLRDGRGDERRSHRPGTRTPGRGACARRATKASTPRSSAITSTPSSRRATASRRRRGRRRLSRSCDPDRLHELGAARGVWMYGTAGNRGAAAALRRRHRGGARRAAAAAPRRCSVPPDPLRTPASAGQLGCGHGRLRPLA